MCACDRAPLILANLAFRKILTRDIQCHLKKLVNTNELDDNALIAYQKFMMGLIVESNIGAQEIYHMLQKNPLVICSQPFVSLNVSKKNPTSNQ